MKDDIIKNLQNNTLSSILSIYNSRKDLQEVFPEVKKKDYFRLIKWGISVCEQNDSKKLSIKYNLIRHYDWYKDYINKHKNSS